jgi:hypothetical protein
MVLKVPLFQETFICIIYIYNTCIYHVEDPPEIRAHHVVSEVHKVEGRLGALEV